MPQNEFTVLPVQSGSLQVFSISLSYTNQKPRNCSWHLFPSHCVPNSILSPVNLISINLIMQSLLFTATTLTVVFHMDHYSSPTAVTDLLRKINKILNIVWKALHCTASDYLSNLSLEHTTFLPISGLWHTLSLLPFYLVNPYLSFWALLKGSFFRKALLSSPD